MFESFLKKEDSPIILIKNKIINKCKFMAVKIMNVFINGLNENILKLMVILFPFTVDF